MSTPIVTRGDLLIRNIWNHQTWLHSGRAYHESRCPIEHSPETGSSPSFPGARKEQEIPPSLSRATPSLLSLCGFMWWKAWKRSHGSTTKPSLAKKSESPIPKLKLHEVQDDYSIVRATLCIRGSRIPTSRMSQHPLWEAGAGLSLFYYKAQQTYLKIELTVKGSTMKIVHW